MTPKETFTRHAYTQLKTAVQSIPEEADGDVYAVSFWFYFDNDDLQYPRISVSYNTAQQYESEVKGASSKEEAKWNFAFWLQDEVGGVGGDEDESMKNWYAESGLGDDFGDAFIEVVISLTKQLFGEGIVESTFGKNIPILVHELEYYEEPIDWTTRANPAGVADEFLAAYNAGKL